MDSLATWLKNPEVSTDTDSAFDALFASWNLTPGNIGERTGCELAADAGLNCVFNTGTWKHLLGYNRPAIIELLDKAGQRHHVLVSELSDNAVRLVFGGRSAIFDRAEVDRYWYGKYLLAWRPAITSDALRLGDEGRDVIWLRQALAAYSKTTVADGVSPLFDAELEASLKQFQLAHGLSADGVAGRFTLVQLNSYLVKPQPPRLTAMNAMMVKG